jgi:succinate dehydrogenase/fumarate reductase flavoprotein subunit
MKISSEYDVVVLGAGAGGMTAACVAAAEGLRVVLIEKSPFVGGTTAVSGGMVWIPANAKAKQVGMGIRPNGLDCTLSRLSAAASMSTHAARS